MSCHHVFKQCVVGLALVALVGASASAQRPGGFGQREPGGFGGRGGFGGFGRGDAASFALRDDVKEELNLSDGQVDQLARLSEEGRPDFRELMQDVGDIRNMSPEERREAMSKVREAVEKQNQQLREKVVGVLNGQQKDRFAELEFQFALTSGDLARALGNAKVDLNEQQRQQLQQSMRDMNRQLQARIAELRLQMQKEALAEVVSPSKLDELMGKVFAFENPRARGGPGGGFFGPGGNRGGRQRGGDAGNPRRPQRPAAGDDEPSSNPRRRR